MRYRIYLGLNKAMFKKEKVLNGGNYYHNKKINALKLSKNMIKFGKYKFDDDGTGGHVGYYIIGTDIFIQEDVFCVYRDLKNYNNYEYFNCIGKAINMSKYPKESFMGLLILTEGIWL